MKPLVTCSTRQTTQGGASATHPEPDGGREDDFSFPPLRPAGDPDEEDGHRGIQRNHKDLRGAVPDSGALQQGLHREVPPRGQRQGDPKVGRYRGIASEGVEWSRQLITFT